MANFFGAPCDAGPRGHRVRPLFRASATWDGALPCALRRHPWRYQPFETWNGKGRGWKGKCWIPEWKESFTTKTPRKTRQQKGRSSETPLKEKRKKPGYNRKQKRIRPRLVCSKASFLQVNFCCFFRSDWTWVMDSRPLKMQTKKTRNLFPQKRRPCFGLDSNSPPNLYKHLVLLLNAENFFF